MRTKSGRVKPSEVTHVGWTKGGNPPTTLLRLAETRMTNSRPPKLRGPFRGIPE